MIKQLRASGGIWVSYKGTNIVIDPGPGSIVHCAKSRPKLDPTKLDAILLTHRHLDHCNDINVMIEAMTQGGFKQRGKVFLPQDALGDDAVILKYFQKLVAGIEFLKEGVEYSIGNIEFQVPKRMVHPVETYGIKFKLADKSVALVSDTKYFEGLERHYKADIIIINVVFSKPREDIQHLSIEDAKRIIAQICPEKTILTHFGMSMLKARPHILAESLKKELDMDIIAAYDGMSLGL